MKGPLLALAALTTVTVTGHAQAQIMKNPTFLASEAQTYFGFGIGHSKHKKYCDAIQSIPSFIGSCDDSGEAVKVFGGYKFKSWVGMELGYTNLGRSSADGLFNGTPVIGRWKGSGVDLSAGLYWPLG
ncbi:MAG: hypothetical protein KIT73_07990, partial [Burkholderiales bacterium]|nr:hypothetical protein [Burkholderiales bacterium]